MQYERANTIVTIYLLKWDAPVGSESLGLEDMEGGVKMTVPVPSTAAGACQPGWTISGCVGKSARGWRLVEIWNVYA